MRPILLTLIMLLSIGAAALADDQSDRQKLIGSWELQSPSGSTPAISWTFTATGHSMRVKQLEGGSKVAEFECETEGTPCEIKAGGKRAMVSLWFNGPRLVEMETKGSDVVKRRFKVLPASDTMEMEVIPIVPGGKTETFEFKRAQLASR
jgi:hypothetical protein